MIEKPHVVVQPAQPTAVIHQSMDGQVIEKKPKRGEGFKQVFAEAMRKEREK